jgi:hypothetical protein
VIASCFWVSVERPGLLGQLILATVAIHAARNSLIACGVTSAGVMIADSLELRQACNKNKLHNEKTIDSGLLNMMNCILISYSKGRIK